MDKYIYYIAFGVLLLQTFVGGLAIFDGTTRLLKLRKGNSKPSSLAYFILFRGLATLAIGVILIRALQSEMFSSWVPLVACWVYMAGEHFVDKYFRKRLVESAKS